MRKNQLLSNVLIMIFCLGILFPLMESGLPITNVGEIPIDDVTTSGIPSDNPVTINAAAPSLYTPQNNVYLRDTTPTFDWSDVFLADRYNIQISKYSSFSTIYINVERSVSTYTPSSPMGQGTYYWRVRSRHLLLFWGSWSSARSFTIDTYLPTSPQLLTPTNGKRTNDNTVNFDWNSVSGCNLYRFQIDETSSFTSPSHNFLTSSTTYNSGPLPDNLYYWRVQAKDFAGNWGHWSSSRYFVVDTTPPGIPTLLSPVNGLVTTAHILTFNWSAVDSASVYRIRVSNTSYFEDSVIDTYTHFTTLTSGIIPDGYYYWHVQAFDYVGNEGSWGPLWNFEIDNIPPEDPVLLYPVYVITSENPTPFYWLGSSDDVLYHVQVDNDSYFGSPIIDTDTDQMDIMIPDLSDDFYYWRVMAKDDVGLWGSYSDYSIFVVDTTSPVISNSGVTPTTPDDDDTPVFHCNVSDLNGFQQTAVLHYRIDGGIWYNNTMYWIFGDTYEYAFSVLPYGTLVEYYFKAYDSAYPSNSALDDNGGSYYNFTVISHDTTGPTIDGITQEPDNPHELDLITISANITDSSGIFCSKLFYRLNGGVWVYDDMALDTGDTYATTIGFLSVGDVVEYYIEATDYSAILNVAINDNSGSYYGFTVGTSDSTGPIISNIHYTPNNPNETDTITIICYVTDFNDVQSTILHYRSDGGDWMTVNMLLVSGQLYEANIGSFNYGVFVEYFISAVDNHTVHNVAIEDNGGLYYNLTIGSSDVTGPWIYSINFVGDATDADDLLISCYTFDIEHCVLYVTLYYRLNGGSWLAIDMPLERGDIYTVNIGIYDSGDVIEFYVIAVDDSPIQNTSINDNEGAYYEIVIGSSDVTGPEITDIVHSQNPTDTDLVNITCTAWDYQNEVQSVTLFYRINDGSWVSTTMTWVSGDLYEASIGPFTAGDVVTYYFVSVDDSPNHNSATEDNYEAFYSFTIAENTAKTSLYYILPLLAVFSLAVLIRKRK
ncbi:MAG: hypothetical protein ACTSPM_01800 [Candidatus Heimdallarchaeota archaeon]